MSPCPWPGNSCWALSAFIESHFAHHSLHFIHTHCLWSQLAPTFNETPLNRHESRCRSYHHNKKKSITLLHLHIPEISQPHRDRQEETPCSQRMSETAALRSKIMQTRGNTNHSYWICEHTNILRAARSMEEQRWWPPTCSLPPTWGISQTLPAAFARVYIRYLARIGISVSKPLFRHSMSPRIFSGRHRSCGSRQSRIRIHHFEPITLLRLE